MKRSTALRYSVEIARRVHAINGLLATPLCGHEAVRISRVWVFGSTAKGALAPNDLDLLIELRECGRRRTAKHTRTDKRLYRDHGLRLAPSAREDCLKWLTRGMRMVSRHCADTEFAVIDVKKMIYPKYEMERE